MLDFLVNRPNHIYEKQKLVQHSTAPPHLVLPRSRLYVNTYYALFTAGMLGVVYSSYHMIRGKKTG
ncbi:uncharacterized protein PHACADRAFT_192254 [Phanerochaete carnosa HHB-10118-sp]|uniref:Uncharacterized protein n=1 Tax=Phanerochaete carnosa (strain HHB-10118-sp) TaxID=650164 RepID=K5XAC8_PHACS|nr:uncharacterized protein PHACADRAFT_192254 [Phanerochaete carnosa HHB-10118-sp]EKM59862.1 hypothetical protein PHACADRAFT_192254 [Phanerochaete carnosa HHB-10118-sp]